jgi:hypothetical protein
VKSPKPKNARHSEQSEESLRSVHRYNHSQIRNQALQRRKAVPGLVWQMANEMNQGR